MRTTLAVLVLLGVVGCQTRNVTTAPSPVKASAVAREAGSGPTGRSLQMVVVITDDWDAIPGVMRRYERASTLLTSNRPVDDWGKLLGDVAAVSAMLDRLLPRHHRGDVA